MDIIKKAYLFAKDAHKGQVRKYTGEPYIKHPVAVAQILMGISHTNEMIAAALLHDTIEDTETSINDITINFGLTVSNMVLGLSDASFPEDGNRKSRKEIDRIHLAYGSAEVHTIKLADLIDNSKSIIKYDPRFARIYIREMRLLVDVLTKGDPELLRRATEIVDKFEV